MQEEISNNNINEQNEIAQKESIQNVQNQGNIVLPIIPNLNQTANHSDAANTQSTNQQKMKQSKLTDLLSPLIDSQTPKPESQSNEIQHSETKENSNLKDNSTKISLARKNISKILGLEYDANNKLVIAIQLKKPNRVCYFPFVEVKKRIPLVLCEYLESHIELEA